MKKLFTIDDFMVAVIAALGYGFGETISRLSGWNDFWCLVACLVVGIVIEEIVSKIAFSEVVQRRTANRVFTYITFLIIFAIVHYFSIAWLNVSMIDYVLEEFAYVVVLPVIGFVINIIIRGYKVRQIRKLYGDGSGGYVFDVDEDEIRDINRQNREIKGKYEKYDKDCAVTTRTGVYVGLPEKNMIFFRGIPYAKPPVGALRWRAPQSLDEADMAGKIFEAQHFGASAIQVEHKGVILKHHRQSEDCLYLNVCVSERVFSHAKNKNSEKNAKHPVLVLFHHGDFTSGGSVDPLMFGDSFVKKHEDIIFVSFNYRLGIFGFIDFSQIPGGEAYPDTLNLGLLDQIAALQWIKDNIANFGGDPENITVMGFESGATLILMLASSGRAKELFKRAFVFQGSFAMAYDEPDASRALAQDLLNVTHTHTMAELAALSTDDLKSAAQALWRHLCAPTRDGKFIPVDPYQACRDGAASGIEFIVGIPSNETQVLRSFVGDENYLEYLNFTVNDMKKYFDADMTKAVDEYIDTQTSRSDEVEAKTKLVEQWLALCMYRSAVRLYQGGAELHMMYWDEKPLIENLGSGSVDALAAVLGNNRASQIYGNVLNADVSEALQSLLEKFVNGHAMQLYSNEIKGVDDFEWKPFPNALIVSDNKIICGTIGDKLTNIKGFLEYIIK